MSTTAKQSTGNRSGAGRRRSRAVMAALAATIIVSGGAPTVTPAHAQFGAVKDAWNWFKGKGGMGQRNKDDKERILSVLAHERYVSVSNGHVEIRDGDGLRELYASLREAGKLNRMPKYADDKDNTNSGTFWRSFFDGKDHLEPDMPAVADPIANDNSGLASNIHAQLQVDSIRYADSAATLKVRGIDVMDQDLRRGVATGANVMIQSLNALTGGTSGQAVKWMEEAAKAAKEAQGDPTGTAKGYLKDHVSDALKEIVEDKIKSAMGEANYEKIMEGYKSYGDKQERLKAFMQDMYEKTGDSRFNDAGQLLDKASPEALATMLAEKSRALLDATKQKEKADRDKAADKDKSADKDSSANKDKATDIDQVATKEGQKEKEKTADKDKKAEKDGTGATEKSEGGKSGQDKQTAGADGKGSKSWDDMSDAEKRDALKANDPAAWQAFGELTAKDPNKAVAILSTKKSGKPEEPKGDGSAPDLGTAIADAGADTSNEEVTSAPTTPAPVPSSPSTTSEVEGGWLEDSNGRTKVVYINDAKGNRIGGYYIHYDKNGREIGRETFTETPNTPTVQEPAATLSGRYQGPISGASSGSIALTVSGSSVNGTVTGVFKGDSFRASFSGSLNGDGSFSAPAQGVLQGNWGDHVTPYPFNGRVSGRVDGRGGTGTWSGKNQWGGGSGTWRASKG